MIKYHSPAGSWEKRQEWIDRVNWIKYGSYHYLIIIFCLFQPRKGLFRHLFLCFTRIWLPHRPFGIDVVLCTLSQPNEFSLLSVLKLLVMSTLIRMSNLKSFINLNYKSWILLLVILTCFLEKLHFFVDILTRKNVVKGRVKIKSKYYRLARNSFIVRLRIHSSNVLSIIMDLFVF